MTRPGALFLGRTVSLWTQAALTWSFGALLATLILTAGLPVLVAGTQAAVTDDPRPWLLLVVYDVITVTTAWATFPALLEE